MYAPSAPYLIDQTLEITLISAENLRINGHSIKKGVFARISINAGTGDHATPKIYTEGGIARGSYPTWDEKFMLSLPGHARELVMQVHCKSSSGNSTVVGTARIRVSEILHGYVPAHCLQFLSYRLKDHKGCPNGIINFSVRVVNT